MSLASNADDQTRDVEGEVPNADDQTRDLESMNKSQLLEVAKQKGIDGVNSKTTNADLIEAIKNA